MEQTFQALGGLLVKAIPTICFLLLLHFYFKAMLFGPLEKVLKQRDELTEGARKAAQASLAAAERKEQEYETKLRDARSEVYRAQEETRRRWLEDQASQTAQARQRSEAAVRAAREQIAADAAASHQSLAETSSKLADEIVTVILARPAGSAA
jgi:F-type H+-transporting ATPase subunit b